MRQFAVIAVCCIMLAAPRVGAQAPDPHGHHPVAATVGTVDFPTSCNAAVQLEINRAVALLHSFQFGPAIDSFKSVLKRDPACGIAYWGIALASWSNPFAGFKSPAQLAQGLETVRAGRTAPPNTARERAYIDAVAHLYVDSSRIDQRTRMAGYEAAMAKVSADYPGDTEARIFYALALAAAADPADKTYAKQKQAGAILEPLFARQPDHPGLAHYIIHAYDEPALAARAEAAASRYGAIAPATPHALHMPSHTFTRIGDWQASIGANAQSAASARRAGQPADVLHASDYMVYAYLQSAQDGAARQIVTDAAQVFQRFDPQSATGAAPASAAFFANAAIPARYCLERRDWAGAAALRPHPSSFAYADAITLYARGVGAAHLGNATLAQQSIAALVAIGDRLRTSKDHYWAAQAEIERLEVAAQLAVAQKDLVQALALLNQAVAMESVTELASITPGPFVPAREMLGELLLQMKQPAEALVQFRATLVRQPNRYWTLFGAAQAAKAAGDATAARNYFRQLLAIARDADGPPRASLAEAWSYAGAAAPGVSASTTLSTD
jgi:hypothetical protein